MRKPGLRELLGVTIGIFGIDNEWVNLAVSLLVFGLFVLYIALVWWTLQDVRRRTEDPVLIACAVIASLIPFIGPLVYSIVRSPEYLEDVRERELELEASELRLAELKATACPGCGHRPIHQNYLVCPRCSHRLKVPCPSCSRPVSVDWRACPFCEAPLARRRQPTEEGAPRRRAGGAPKAAAKGGPATKGGRPRPSQQGDRPRPSKTERSPAGKRQGAERPERPARKSEPAAAEQSGDRRKGGGDDSKQRQDADAERRRRQAARK